MRACAIDGRGLSRRPGCRGERVGLETCGGVVRDAVHREVHSVRSAPARRGIRHHDRVAARRGLIAHTQRNLNCVELTKVALCAARLYVTVEAEMKPVPVMAKV